MLYTFRSLIFVPGNNPRFLDKARSLGADIVCLDLEDSVPPSQKTAAKGMVSAALERGGFDSKVFVRTNSPASGMAIQDLEAVCSSGLEGVVVPKVDRPADLDGIYDTLMQRCGRVSIIPSIESAAGVVNSYDIASCAGVSALVFGVFDLFYDMGIEYSADIAASSYGRSKVSLDAAAAGVPAIDGIWQDIKDVAGFEADCVCGRSLGYSGKSLIHPEQLDTAHRVFAPTAPEIDWAKRVSAAYHKSANAGKGATLIDGKMIDEVHYKRARAVLDVAEQP